MIAHLVAIGVLAAPVAGTGEIIATPDRTVGALLVPPITVSGPSLPLGAPAFPKPLDPSDQQPFAIDFSGAIDGARRIADIERLSISSAGALLGVTVDETAARAPIISTDGKKVQLWLRVAPSFQADNAFSGAGVQVGVSALVRLDDVTEARLERTHILTVRQL